MSKIIPVLVSADGFSPTVINAHQGDTIEFQPSGQNPPPSVSPDASALFGTSSCPVPSQQTILAKKGKFRLTAGGHTADVLVKKSRDIIEPNPTPTPRK